MYYQVKRNYSNTMKLSGLIMYRIGKNLALNIFTKKLKVKLILWNIFRTFHLQN